MNDVDDLQPHHRDAIRVIRRHRAVVGWLWTIATITTLVGLGSCLLPFGLILNGVGIPSAGGTDEPPAYVAWLIGGGGPAFLVGLGATLLLWQRPGGYDRAEQLIRLADRLGLRFMWPGSAWKWVSAAQDIEGWPRTSGRHRVRVSPGGILLGKRDGVAFALIEPTRMADLIADFQTFVPLRYTFRYNLVFAVRLDHGKQAIGTRIDGDLADEAVVIRAIDALFGSGKELS